jgi:GGDEF domain-containing protein
VSAVAAKLRAALEAPLRVDGHVLTMSASIGVAVFPEDGDTYDALVTKADAGMYLQKALARRTSDSITASGRRS